ncbi:MAG: hypothetical protein AABX52_02865 [Nanoarchaeota archaeon]
MALSKVAPLPTSFLVISMLGFLISMYLVYPAKQFDGQTWGFTFAFLFALMFIASMIAMRRANPDEQLRR